MTAGNLVSKRTTRAFVEDHHHIVEGCSAGPIIHEKQRRSRSQEKEGSWSPARSVKMETPVDIGAEFATNGMVACGVIDIGKEVSKKLQAFKAENDDQKDDEKDHFNFGEVMPGSIYRSSFPHTEDYQFLQTLGLKTIVTLVNKDIPPEFKAFMKANNICHKVIELPGTKKVAISEAIMQSIMDVALDKQNYPLLIHCNHGKHRTGCVVAVIRHAHGVAVSEIEKEYRKFAGEKVRECDIKYIKEYQVSSLHHFHVAKEEKIQQHRRRRRSSKMARYIVIAGISVSVWLTSLYLFPAYKSM